jgi:hypothetical protein
MPGDNAVDQDFEQPDSDGAQGGLGQGRREAQREPTTVRPQEREESAEHRCLSISKCVHWASRAIVAEERLSLLVSLARLSPADIPGNSTTEQLVQTCGSQMKLR